MFTDKVFISNKIKYYRKLSGLTQAELAELIGITDKHVCKIENATYTPSLETFLKLAKALKFDFREFGLELPETENETRNKFLRYIYNLNDSELEFMYNCCLDIDKNLKMLKK